ncbi:MAG: hypothetical protein JSU65_11005 [Candidatus Zixiibacteriota bacterium]|nr:MAG: hypothetical protein JSU65_11005 [candidate division Zixibacteria bacterium]
MLDYIAREMTSQNRNPINARQALLGGAVLIFMMCMTMGIECPNGDSPPTPTLAGQYTGTYHLMTHEGSDTLTDTLNHVDVRFGAETYVIKVTDSADILFFCSSSGEYEVLNGVEFFEEESNLAQDSCDSEHNPRGFFGLDQVSSPGSLIIKQDLTDDTGLRSVKTLTLTLVVD